MKDYTPLLDQMYPLYAKALDSLKTLGQAIPVEADMAALSTNDK